MLVKIVVDSALNIPGPLLQELGITVIPVCVAIDNQTYREGKIGRASCRERV